jgi:hypothetical protein
VDILSWGGGEREKEEEEEKRNGLGHGDLGEEKGHARGPPPMVHAQVMIQGSL